MLDAEDAKEAMGPLGAAIAALLEEAAGLAALSIGEGAEMHDRIGTMRSAIDDAALLMDAVAILLRRAGYSGAVP